MWNSKTPKNNRGGIGTYKQKRTRLVNLQSNWLGRSKRHPQLGSSGVWPSEATVRSNLHSWAIWYRNDDSLANLCTTKSGCRPRPMALPKAGVGGCKSQGQPLMGRRGVRQEGPRTNTRKRLRQLSGILICRKCMARYDGIYIVKKSAAIHMLAILALGSCIDGSSNSIFGPHGSYTPDP